MTQGEKRLVQIKLDQALYDHYLARNMQHYLTCELRLIGQDLELVILTSKPPSFVKDKSVHAAELHKIASSTNDHGCKLKVRYLAARHPYLFAKFYYDALKNSALRRAGSKVNLFNLAQNLVERCAINALKGIRITVAGKKGTRNAKLTYSKGLVKNAGKFLADITDCYVGQLVDSRGATGISVTITRKDFPVGLRKISQ